jgi:predicted O-methyltransferase YrrM
MIELTDEELLENLKETMSYSDHSDGFVKLYREVYKLACNLDEDIPFIEIGSRTGGSAMLILRAIKDSGKRRPFYTVDCHGSDSTETSASPVAVDDWEKVYRQFMLNLSTYAFNEKMNWIHFRMRSLDFLYTYETMTLYKGFNRFGFVYLDGDHRPEVVDKELFYFWPRIVSGGLVVVDDVKVNLEWTDAALNNYLNFIQKCSWYDEVTRAYLWV